MSSTYPAAVDTFDNNTDWSGDPNAAPATARITASDVNNVQDAIVAVQDTLGVNPQGSHADVAARLAALTAPDWTTGAVYIVGQLVTSSGTLYRCTTGHTAGGSFDGSKFTAIGGGGGGAVSSVVGQTGAVTGTQILADSTVAAALAAKASTASVATAQATADAAGTLAASKADAAATTSALAGKAPTTRAITAGTGLAGGGDLSADRSLAVSFGTTTGTAAQGDDTRITGAAQKAANLSDLASAATARTNLGLGSAAVETPASLAANAAFTGSYAPLSHGHSAADISSGTLPLARGGTGGTDAATARTSLGLGGSATRNVGTTSTTVAAGDAPVTAAQNATVAGAFGVANGAPISPWQPAPSYGVELWQLQYFQTGGGRNSTTLTPTITCNGTAQTITTTIRIDNIFGSQGNRDSTYRLEFDYSMGNPSGWSAISVAYVDTAGSLISGSQEQYLVAASSPRKSGHYIIDLQPPGVGLDLISIVLKCANNAPSGVLSLSNVSLKACGRQSRPMLISKEYNTGNFPLIYVPQQDIATDTWKYSKHSWANEGNLTWSFNGVDGTTSDQFLINQLPDPYLVRSGMSMTSGPGNEQNSAGSMSSLRINNNDQILSVWNGSAYELRCNTHGGEYNDGGITWEVDRGTGFAAWTLTHGLDPVRRVRVTMPTYVCTTTAATQTKTDAFATVAHTFTYFPDGMVRCDRTTTFLKSTQLGGVLEWMSSHAITVPYLGRIGRGLTVLGEIDQHPKVTSPTLTPTTATTGGTLAAATYTYRIAAFTPYGEATPSAAVTQVTTGTTSTVTLTWSAASNATGYRIYGRTGGVERLIATVGAVTTWTDDGSLPAQPVAPQTVNNGRYYPGTTNPMDSDFSTDVTWAVFHEPRSGWCQGMIYDRDSVLARAGVSALRTRIEQGSGINKMYNDVIYSATPTIAPGTTWTATHYAFTYLPRRAAEYHDEIAVRAANFNSLASIYPNT